MADRVYSYGDPNAGDASNEPAVNIQAKTPLQNMIDSGLENTSALNDQAKAYQDFMNNMPSRRGILEGQAINQGQNEYQNSKQAITQNANKRGLLYSGMKQGAESDAANKSAYDTAKGIQKADEQTQDLANKAGQGVYESQMQEAQGIGNVSMGMQGNAAAGRGQAGSNAGGLMSGVASLAALL